VGGKGRWKGRKKSLFHEYVVLKKSKSLLLFFQFLFPELARKGQEGV
jgi:hypothetical protein